MKIQNVRIGQRVQIKPTCPCFDKDQINHGTVAGFTARCDEKSGVIVQVHLDGTEKGCEWECPAGGLRKVKK